MCMLTKGISVFLSAMGRVWLEATLKWGEGDQKVTSQLKLVFRFVCSWCQIYGRKISRLYMGATFSSIDRILSIRRRPLPAALSATSSPRPPSRRLTTPRPLRLLLSKTKQVFAVSGRPGCLYIERRDQRSPW